MSETTDTHNGLTSSPSLTPSFLRDQDSPRQTSGWPETKDQTPNKGSLIMGLNPMPTTQLSLSFWGGKKQIYSERNTLHRIWANLEGKRPQFSTKKNHSHSENRSWDSTEMSSNLGSAA